MGRIWICALLLASGVVFGGPACGVRVPNPPPIGDPLKIQVIAPPEGPAAGGTTITISGTGFSTLTTVTIGGAAVLNQSVTGTHTIICDSPTGVVGGADVVVTKGQISQTEVAGFTYGAPTPTVAAVGPLWGPLAGGNTITVLGSGFRLGASVTIGGNPATAVTVLSGGRVTCSVPSGTAGPAAVAVTTSGPLTGTLPNGYFYDAPAPTLGSINGTTGPGTGGTTITLTGTGFFVGASVSIGGVYATAVNVTSPTSATAVTPDVSYTTVAQDVVFRNVDTDFDTLFGAFTPATVGGARVATFAGNGVAFFGVSGHRATGAVQDGTNLYVVGDTTNPDEWRMGKLQLSDGAKASFFGPSSPGGTIRWSTGPHDNEARAVAIRGADLLVVGVDHASAATAGNARWRLEARTTANGSPGYELGNPSVYTDDPSVGDDLAIDIVSDGTSAYIVGTDGGSTSWRLVKRTITGGQLDTGFGTGGVITSQAGVAFSTPVAMIDDGTSLYILGTVDLGGGDSEWRVEKRAMSTGALDTGFGTSGVLAINPSSGLDPASDLTSDGTNLYVAGHDDTPGDHQWRIEAVTMSTGASVTGFGTTGVLTFNPSAAADGPSAIVADGSALYLLGYDEAPGDRQWRLEKRALSSGALDGTFGNGGVIWINPSAGADTPTTLLVDATHLYLTGSDWRVEKRTK